MSAALIPSPPSRMTLDEFLGWDAPGQEIWQLIDGEPVAMAPASELHGTLQAECGALLRNHLLEHRQGCRVVITPGVVPRTRANANFRVPDLAITCSPPTGSQILNEPVVLLEILSPSNERETRTAVWAYATIPSVQEILLLRSSRIEGELLLREPGGNWPANPTILRGSDPLTLPSIGFTAPLAALYRTTGLQP
jgi:Uma2 family endonuclease